jgi:hypothetical protein
LENQHTLIKGYRDLSEVEIAAMNEVKALAEKAGELVGWLQNRNLEANGFAPDQRWISIAKTDLQTGFMALVRSIAQPTTF